MLGRLTGLVALVCLPSVASAERVTFVAQGVSGDIPRAPTGGRWTTTRQGPAGAPKTRLELVGMNGRSVYARFVVFVSSDSNCPARFAYFRNPTAKFRVGPVAVYWSDDRRQDAITGWACGHVSVRSGRRTTVVVRGTLTRGFPNARRMFEGVTRGFLRAIGATGGSGHARGAAWRGPPSRGGSSSRAGLTRIESRNLTRRDLIARLRRQRSTVEKKNKRSFVSNGNAYFASAALRTWMNPPSRVPKRIVVDDPLNPSGPPGFFENTGWAWNLRAGAVIKNIHVAGSFDRYFGDVRSGASPSVYQVEVGLGGRGKSWSKGGPITIRSTSSEYTDRNGNPCPKINSGDSESDVDYKLRSASSDCGKYLKVENSEYTMNMGPAWVHGRVSVFGGWRHITGMLGGDSPDPDLPLVSGGGPVLGAVAYFRRGIFAGEVAHEFAYYVHGWDDHGRFGYSGRVGFGSFPLFMEFRWRLDPGIGKEFTIGINARLDR